MGFPDGAVVKNPPSNAGNIKDMSLTPVSGRSPGGGNGKPIQYSFLGNPMDRGAWWVTVCRVAKSQTWLRDWAGKQLSHAFSLLLTLHCRDLRSASPALVWDIPDSWWYLANSAVLYTGLGVSRSGCSGKFAVSLSSPSPSPLLTAVPSWSLLSPQPR